MRTLITAGLLATLLASATDVRGQEAQGGTLAAGTIPITLTLKAGTSRLNGGGDVFRLFRQTLAMSESAFDSGLLEMELSAALGARTDVFIGGSIRNGQEVVTGGWANVGGFVSTEQVTRLSITPGVHVGGRMFAVERQERGARRTAWSANPYVTLGVGRGSYSLRQSGQFVDHATLEGFEATFAAKDGYFRGFLGVGIDFAVTPRLGVTMEGRRDFASPTPVGDFHQFEDLSLSGETLTLGIRWR